MTYSNETRDVIKKELLTDFYSELSNIDFSNYRPDSSEFMYPLSIGMLYWLLCQMEKEGESDIQEEIDGARKYLELYKSTSDMGYHTMATDELKHAKMLMGLKKVKHPNIDLSKYESQIEKLQALL